MRDKKDILKGIFDRLKSAEGKQHDIDIADIFDVSRSRIEQWKFRGTIPFEYLVAYAEDRGISLDWLMFGKGPMWSDEIGVADPASYYRVKTNCDVSYAIAGMLYEELQRSGGATSGAWFADTVKFIHRDAIESGRDIVSPDKIADLVKLLILN